MKRKYFDNWSSNTSTEYIIPIQVISNNISNNTLNNISNNTLNTISHIISDSIILSKLCNVNFNNIDDKDIETIETMRIILEKIKDDNEKIENLLSNKLNIDNLKEEEEKDEPTIYKCIKNPMTSIRQLIEIGELYEKYKDYDNLYFNIDLRALYNMREPLEKLDSMIGLLDIKEKIIEQILFYIQHLESGNNDFLHTTLYGNPGVGKTELGRILGKIYSSLGFLSSGHVIEAKAEDFIGTVVGQTAVKTRTILDKALGGVLVIDEAYALGNKDSKSYIDDFISTLLPFLTEHRNDFVCIFMGYKKDIEENIFSKNKGLKRRFPNSYNIKDYNSEELRNILIKKIKEYGWYYDENSILLKSFNKCIKDNEYVFKDNGGSMENLFKHIKRVHSKRVLYYPPEKKKTINNSDFENGLLSYLESIKDIDEETDNKLYQYIYT